ncbi:GNAT family N-acetyltransferase [Acinetobacter proteolyticus]|uniref:GNAT family N-acetyltransferase n=1 Tax=Acinetobacter proteolyticus TaxID=1776741 RepID=UPI003D95173E
MPPKSKEDNFKYHLGKAMPPQDIVNFFSHHSEVSFVSQSSIDEFKKIIQEPNTIIVTASNEFNQIVAILIGGTLGTRATINHVAINNAYRRYGIGTVLVNKFEIELRNRGIARYFLFVEKNNAIANKFWEKMNFYTTSNAEVTYEKNLI